MATLLECPFCGGPPVLLVKDSEGRIVEYDAVGYGGEDGLSVRSFVFCHECGAEGPEVEEWIYWDFCYLRVVQEAAEAWNLRDKRNISMYEHAVENKLNTIPESK